MKNYSALLTIMLAMTCCLASSCSGNLNPVNDRHFDSEGRLQPEYKDSLTFEPCMPTNIKFYVEVSGSMNGFFRANKPTQFKADVWNILTYYSPHSQKVTILTNDGSAGASFTRNEFQTQMNTGQFVSTASTKVPLMLQSIIDNLNTETGEVAVLISDMKYSPVGDAAPEVLLTQYSTTISDILGNYGKAACLIGATSDYVDKNGNTVCARSPYYFLILGNAQQVAMLRNGISTLLNNNHHLIDNIESGFDYGHPKYSLGIPIKCEEMPGEPVFYNYEEPDDIDTCTVSLKIELANYRWLIDKKEVLNQCIKAQALHGSALKIEIDTIMVQNITNKQLVRTATATVKLKVFNMPQDADVIEWAIDLPDTATLLFDEFLDGADSENDVCKSFSVKDFINGMFYGGIVNQDVKPNYILITKNN